MGISEGCGPQAGSRSLREKDALTFSEADLPFIPRGTSVSNESNVNSGDMHSNLRRVICCTPCYQGLPIWWAGHCLWVGISAEFVGGWGGVQALFRGLCFHPQINPRTAGDTAFSRFPQPRAPTPSLSMVPLPWPLNTDNEVQWPRLPHNTHTHCLGRQHHPSPEKGT